MILNHYVNRFRQPVGGAVDFDKSMILYIALNIELKCPDCKIVTEKFREAADTEFLGVMN
ncbi:hypothetical protein [Macrococcus lamae]|uniref:Uncharacterized protein n=1 Tax=Macrococcus lamae TaxID=198484 RepID=A0A4R6BXV9_9STAP|nr:hypothetical protein [Macrococcus lamae]TDM13060.1 hypothetical protein ERX29_00210 [Macrococcus lamae]